ncbi:hypothetical protein PENOC_110710 [Penicillium occitanis (nom. inval.)]|nr:hypothetical protein PENOC_110710 [Penicillium occitanis (nom. inval.)]
MTSSSHNPKAQAQVATAPDSPHQKTPSSEEKIQRHIKAIHDLLADKESGISRTRRPHSDNSIADKLEQISKAIEAVAETRKVQPLDDGSAFLTENRLADSIEVAWGSVSSSGTGYASSSAACPHLIQVFRQIFQQIFQQIIHHPSLPDNQFVPYRSGLDLAISGDLAPDAPFDNQFVPCPSGNGIAINNYKDFIRQLPGPNSPYSNAFYPLAKPSPYGNHCNDISWPTHVQPFETFDSCHIENHFRTQSYSVAQNQPVHSTEQTYQSLGNTAKLKEHEQHVQTGEQPTQSDISPETFKDKQKAFQCDIVLLHGPPGVGKTLTAEAISERLQRPLYSLELGKRFCSLMKRLCICKKDSLQLERNDLVATFHRMLEHHDGIILLTTNMLQDPDSAILDRIDLNLQYRDLDESARKSLFRYYLPEGSADLEEALTQFSKVRLSGRQIQKAVKTACIVAEEENTESPKMQDSYSSKTDVNLSSCDQDNMSGNPSWSQDIADGLSIARAFFEHCESSDEGSASMDLDNDTEVTSTSSTCGYNGEDDSIPSPHSPSRKLGDLSSVTG